MHKQHDQESSLRINNVAFAFEEVDRFEEECLKQRTTLFKNGIFTDDVNLPPHTISKMN